MRSFAPGHAQHVIERGGKIAQANGSGNHGSRGNPPGPANDQGNANPFLVDVLAMVHMAVGHQALSMIAGHHHESFGVERAPFECRQQTTDLLIGIGKKSVVEEDRAIDLECFAGSGHEGRIVAPGQEVGVVGIEIVHEEEEGLLGMGSLSEPFERSAGGVVGPAVELALDHTPFPEPTSGQDIGLGEIRIEMIEALGKAEGLGEHVGTDHRRRLVTRRRQSLRQGLELVFQGSAILHDTVCNGGQCGEEAGVARGRGRRGRIRRLEKHALLGQGPQRRRGVSGIAVRREMIGPGGIHRDQQHVGARILAPELGGIRTAGQGQQEQGQASPKATMPSGPMPVPVPVDEATPHGPQHNSSPWGQPSRAGVEWRGPCRKPFSSSPASMKPPG